MNERQAFGWAVRSLRLYDWKSDQPRFQVNGDSLTIRELCERAKKLDEPLPEVIKYDLYPIVCTENSNSDIMVMQSAKDRVGMDTSSSLNWARERCVLI